MQTETLNWTPVTEALPDDDTTVLIYDGEETSLGFHESQQWYEGLGAPISTVTHWAHMPEGPQ